MTTSKVVTLEQLRKELQIRKDYEESQKEYQEAQEKVETKNNEENRRRLVATKKAQDEVWKRMQPAMFAFWSRRDRWTMLELAFLLEGKEPIREKNYGTDFIMGIIREKMNWEVLQEDAICTKKLTPVSTIPEIKFSPPDLLAWAKSKCFEIPKELEHILPLSALTNQERIEKETDKNKKLRTSTKIKLACQEIALTLWIQYPEMTITDMVGRGEIQECGANNYDKKTVHIWLSEVDPRPLNMKTGRPRKK